MRSIALLLAQAATVVASADNGADCSAAADEIVVCGRGGDPARYRLPPLPPEAQTTGPPRAEWRLGGGVRVGASVSQKAMPQGALSNRVMATVKIPF